MLGNKDRQRGGGGGQNGFIGSVHERHSGQVAISPALPLDPARFTNRELDGPRRLSGAAAPAASVASSVPPALLDRRGAAEAGAAYLWAKRAIDIVGASAGLLLLLPLFLLVALLVALDSPGPVLHRRRVLARQPWEGTDGQLDTFDAFKFRTMRADADEYLAQNPELWAAFQKEFKLSDDPRVTRLGRFLRRTSIDELPQLWNVLMGQMSLVGPRMITPGELSRYAGHEGSLLSAIPGLTGLWQVSGRTNTGYEERVRLDVSYIYGRSLSLDIEILFKTVHCVLAGRGAV